MMPKIDPSSARCARGALHAARSLRSHGLPGRGPCGERRLRLAALRAEGLGLRPAPRGGGVILRLIFSGAEKIRFPPTPALHAANTGISASTAWLAPTQSGALRRRRASRRLLDLAQSLRDALRPNIPYNGLLPPFQRRGDAAAAPQATGRAIVPTQPSPGPAGAGYRNRLRYR